LELPRGDAVRPVVVIPSYNEAENIRPLIESVHAVVSDIDIVVVDNDSPDSTGRLVEAIAAKDARVRLLQCRSQRGFSEAYVTGGFKCWRRTALAAIDLDAVLANGFAFQMEMNYRAWKGGLRIKEIPIIFPDRTVGESKMKAAQFWESLAMPWRLRRLNI